MRIKIDHLITEWEESLKSAENKQIEDSTDEAIQRTVVPLIDKFISDLAPLKK